MSLSVEEKDKLLASLNIQQRQYLLERLIRSRRTTFANIMARAKWAFVPPNSTFEEIEALLDEWVYTHYIDAGEVTPELRCECGRPLRYQHIVEHKTTGQVMKFGIQHLQDHLGIDAKMVQDIMEGFQAIDYEMDEILEKINRNWDNADKLPPGYESIEMPADIKDHLALNIPLLNAQLVKLRGLINNTGRPSRSVMPSPPTYRTAAKDAQLDLFALTDAANEVGGGLSQENKEIITSYLQSGIRSARIICEKLIQDKRVTEDRFLTDKPRIYLDVCFYIDDLVLNGYCKLLEQNHEDRKYVWL